MVGSLNRLVVVLTVAIAAGVLFVALGNAFVGAEIVDAEISHGRLNKYIIAANVGFSLFVALIVIAAVLSVRLWNPRIRKWRALGLFCLQFALLTIVSYALAVALLLSNWLAPIKPALHSFDPLWWMAML